MAQNDTVDRILHAATILFAERGFAETSLRTITGMADVNLAAVNYHFGSKKALIQAVFSRFLNPFCRELDVCMDELERISGANGGSPEIKPLLTCLFNTLFKATAEINEDPQRFMRLLSLAYTQSQEHLRHHLAGNFGGTYGRFSDMMKRAMPELDPVSMYWRIYFMLGAAIFTLSSFESIRAILNADYHEDSTLEDAIELMIPSVAGMLNAPNE